MMDTWRLKLSYLDRINQNLDPLEYIFKDRFQHIVHEQKVKITRYRFEYEARQVGYIRGVERSLCWTILSISGSKVYD